MTSTKTKDVERCSKRSRQVRRRRLDGATRREDEARIYRRVGHVVGSALVRGWPDRGIHSSARPLAGTGAARALSRRVLLVRRSNLRPKALHKSSHPKRTSDSGRAVSSDDPAAGVSPLALELLLPQRDRVKKVIEVDVAVG